MSLKTSYEIALNDMEYFKELDPRKVKLTTYNVGAAQCSKTAEKFLKHLLITCCVDDKFTEEAVKSHNLSIITRTLVSNGIDIGLDQKKLAYLKDFYFEASYEGISYRDVSLKEINECFEILLEVEQAVTEFLRTKRYCLRCGSKLLSSGECSNFNCK